MNIFLSIDDTDSINSPGSGQLSEVLSQELQDFGLVTQCSSITRHQLFVHEAIPYTSHNSSMCFGATVADHKYADLICFAKQFLEKTSAPGSDPGLCVVTINESFDKESLIAFGLKAKKTILTKQEAYFIAEKTGAHLSEHGGTGDGIVGALAGTGLRLHGNDGRFRGWLQLGKTGQIVVAKSLRCHPNVNDVVDDAGMTVPDDAEICLAEDKVKTVLLNNRQVIPVIRSHNPCGSTWTTLTKAEVKRF